MKLIILLFFVVFTLQIQCQWSTDPNVNNPICTASGDQFSPQIVSDKSGGVIITWEDFRNGNNYDVYAQRISSTGVVLWSLNGVAIAALTKDQTMPSIISDGNGGAIITWTDFQSGNYSDIYAQKISSNGTIQWIANGVSICSAVNSQNNPTIVSDGAGGAIIAWQDKRDGALDIYAQHLNSSGIVSWTTNGVPICTEINKQENPAIASDGFGGAIITWQDYRSNTDYDIYAQRINANGEVQWTANGLSLSSITGNQVYPRIINNKTNEVIITWFDVRNGIDPDIYAQRLSNNGTVLWTNNGVALCTATNLQQFPVLVDDGSGGAIVTWQDYRSGAYDVYAQRIDVDGNVLWTTDGVPISAETDAQIYPDITSDGQGGAIITWRDYRDNGNQDIYAQKIDNNGIVQWTVNGIAVSVATTDQYTPSITTDGNGGAIITWWDYRNGSTSDIYAQQVSNDGLLGIVTDVNDNISASLDLFSLEQNYPNPFNPVTVISYQLPGIVGQDNILTYKVSLKIYNLLGQEVAELVNEEKHPGNYSISWNASGFASGVYFYKLTTKRINYDPQVHSGQVFVAVKKLILTK